MLIQQGYFHRMSLLDHKDTLTHKKSTEAVQHHRDLLGVFRCLISAFARVTTGVQSLTKKQFWQDEQNRRAGILLSGSVLLFDNDG